jgi:hypothetical protein
MQTDANGQPVMLSDPNAMPPKAPKHGRNKSKAAKARQERKCGIASGAFFGSAYVPSASGGWSMLHLWGFNAAAGSPLADGFVDHLVTKYDGHMGNALNNSDTRNWAKAMGVDR